MEQKNITVSICTQTYNHGSFIKQCLEGFVMQKTNFAFEVLINEDASTDDTAEIIREYVTKYPGLIRPIYQTVNQYSQGINTLKDVLLPRSQGRYIALCEGDDYWTDPYKLQKQVDFLESNPDYNICFHNVDVSTNEGLKDDWITNPPDSDSTLINDLISRGNYIHTPSVVFRNVIKEYPLEFSITPIGDIFLYMLLTKNGEKIMQLKDKMAVYRYGFGIHGGNTDINRLWTARYSLFLITHHFKEYKELLNAKLTMSQEAMVNYIRNILLEPDELVARYGVRKLAKAFFLAIYRKVISFIR